MTISFNPNDQLAYMFIKSLWNPKSATSNVPSGKALLYFGLFLASGVFFIFIAFTLFLPVMVVMPQKFAICFTLGCGFIIGSFFALKGPKNQLSHMFSKERLPFTLGFICSITFMAPTPVIFSICDGFEVLSLGYYAISYFPGGSAGMRFLTSALTSRIMTCFGR
ncbi:transport protein SFT2-like [Trifolium pratense]|uniref:Vesicle transport protein n=1 Tax=Trifolium pratense TaxID=57577 RepID=A0A2K3MS52_TRIPR|nr:transport protein SFT2-like [Trifolium pratense]PNX93844.1 transport protein SFT2-like [Trifolium pratense]PNY05968.1 transport protein SFT2-like [Trifolium pratense]